MSITLYANTVGEALDRADSRHWTRPAPRSAKARLRFLLQPEDSSLPTLASRLGIHEALLHQVLTGHRPPADDPLYPALERETVRLWQPRIRRQAHRTILENGGLITVSFRAWFGFTSAAGTTDDPRLRFLTLSLREPYPEHLFTARHTGAAEEELNHILGDALAACYFRHKGSPAALEEVTLKEIDYLEFYY
ncbi:telomere-protecting terminal protein Tpg [Streptomyces botrytidirepellens]|uniref:XRE family transcriptional regulator n=1 Tax=Streptomyces botrytidirepellens TaxID=2486417 RepID=A0A3M8VLI4_9ACTN|nr:XRE family transcriptional regulator [Streptomyces botrytidirepellens]RNG17857.1 XRE family transcriptional regulator [Streptomyces botrytidirepellens]